MDLVEYSTNDLAQELQRRYDAFFAVGMRERLPGEEPDAQMESVYMHGDTLRLVGMIERAKFGLLLDIHEDSEDPGPQHRED